MVKRIARNGSARRGGMAIFAFSAQAMQQFNSMVFLVLAAQFLLPAEYGIYSIAIVFITLLQTLTYTGLYHFIISSPEPDEEVLATGFWLTISLSTIAGLILACFAFPIQWLYETDELGMVLLLFAISQPFSSLSAWASAALIRQQRIRTNIAIMFWQDIIALIFGVTILLTWESLYALVAIRVFRILVGGIAYTVYGVRPPGFRFEKELGRRAMRFASSLYGSRFLSFSSKYAADILLGLFYSVNEVGLYRFGNRLATSATDVLVQPISTFATSQFGKESRNAGDLAKPLTRYTGALALLTGLLGAKIIVFAADAISLFFQPEYLAAVVVTYAMALRALASVGQSMMEPVFAGVGETSWVIRFNVISAIVTIGTVFLTSPLGFTVLAWSQAAVVLLMSCFALWLMHAKGGVSIRGAVIGYLIGFVIAAVYGVVLEVVRLVLLPQFDLTPLLMLITGLAISAMLLPLVLWIGKLAGVFSLEIFRG